MDCIQFMGHSEYRCTGNYVCPLKHLDVKMLEEVVFRNNMSDVLTVKPDGKSGWNLANKPQNNIFLLE